MGPKFNDECPYETKKKKKSQKQKQRRISCEDKTEDGIMKATAKEYREPQEAEKGKEGFSLRASRGSGTLLML